MTGRKNEVAGLFLVVLEGLVMATMAVVFAAIWVIGHVINWNRS